MLRKISLCVAIAASNLVGMGNSAEAQTIRSVRVASGLSMPCYVTAPPGDTTRLFILEQRRSQGVLNRADIRILDLTTNPPTLVPTPFLSISPVSTSDEQGLLGLAFHPDYATNRTFFVYYTNPASQVVRYKTSMADPNVADPASATTILTFSQPFSNHNGGWMGFGPDGYLYIATGDGGSSNDPNGNGQSLNTLLGKMLRISATDTGTYTVPADNPFPGATAPFNTIWAYGLRNPWRNSFDRTSGQIYIADVGQFAIEEVNVQPADVGGNQAGKNYGWRCMEGNNCTGLSGCTCNAPTLTLPVHTYGHGGGNCSVTGGYVYRGSAISGLQGTYFFADYCTATIWSFVYTGAVTQFTNRTASLSPSTNGFNINLITSFGEDAAGEIYICDRGSTSAATGEIFKIIPGPPANDNCASATLVSVGSNTNFNTAGATTDGPNETGCGFAGNTQIGNDIWYKFLANCTGTATVSVCGASFDTRLAAYGPCPTAPGQQLACNDDFCGSASQVSFPVTSGSVYNIRIGGADSATGTGTMTITCTVPPPPCPADITKDGNVNANDLLEVINNWGPCVGCAADITDDDQVNANDLLEVINNWGPCPSGFTGRVAGDSNLPTRK